MTTTLPPGQIIDFIANPILVQSSCVCKLAHLGSMYPQNYFNRLECPTLKHKNLEWIMKSTMTENLQNYY